MLFVDPICAAFCRRAVADIGIGGFGVAGVLVLVLVLVVVVVVGVGLSIWLVPNML